MSDLTPAQELEELLNLSNDLDSYDQQSYHKTPIVKLLNAWLKRNKNASSIFPTIASKTYNKLQYPASVWAFEQYMKSPQSFPNLKPERMINSVEEDFYNFDFEGIEHIIRDFIKYSFSVSDKKATALIETLSDTDFFEFSKNPQKVKELQTWMKGALTETQQRRMVTALPSELASKMNISGHEGLLIKLNQLLNSTLLEFFIHDHHIDPSNTLLVNHINRGIVNSPSHQEAE